MCTGEKLNKEVNYSFVHQEQCSVGDVIDYCCVLRNIRSVGFFIINRLCLHGIIGFTSQKYMGTELFKTVCQLYGKNCHFIWRLVNQFIFLKKKLKTHLCKRRLVYNYNIIYFFQKLTLTAHLFYLKTIILVFKLLQCIICCVNIYHRFLLFYIVI